MYSLGILGSCLWKIFLRPVRMIEVMMDGMDEVTGTKRMIPSLSSNCAGLSLGLGWDIR
jgi:hypothetical protein